MLEGVRFCVVDQKGIFVSQERVQGMVQVILIRLPWTRKREGRESNGT